MLHARHELTAIRGNASAKTAARVLRPYATLPGIFRAYASVSAESGAGQRLVKTTVPYLNH